jgi:RimJ/RimL family protein N-acetyltransferase
MTRTRAELGALHPFGLEALARRAPGRIGRLEPDAALHIAQRLRAWDQREVFALMPRHATAEHAAAIMLAPCLDEVRCAVLAPDGEPVAALGMASFWPGCWQAWLLATDRWSETWRLGVHAVRAVLADAEARGMRRAECRSMAGHDDAHALLRWLGFAPEGLHPGMGRDGEAFITFARVAA